MKAIDTLLEMLEQRVRKCQVKTTMLFLEDKGEIHISIFHTNMGKRHKNVRQSILDRVRKDRILSRYSVYLHLNPRDTDMRCMTFVLLPKSDHWEKGYVKTLPDERMLQNEQAA